MKELLNRALALLYPTRCAFCHNLMPWNVPVCDHCRNTIPRTEGTAQSQSFSHVTKCVSPLYYEGSVRDSLLRYKFHSLTGYAKIYGEFLAKCIDENGISCDSITWVPLSSRRKHSRGYDQAELLAQELSRRTGIPCVRLLRKIRNNPPQSGTGGPAARRANVAGLYRAVTPEKIAGKRILLVDDIVTTGATLSECALMLRKAGASEVFAVTAACARNHGKTQ